MVNFKKTAVLAFFALLLVALVGAVDVLIFSPSDNVIDLDGNLSTYGDSFICSVQATVNTNVSNVSVWDNTTNVWKRNQTNLTGLALGESWQNVTFIPPANFSNAFSFVWGCEACVNGTHAAGGDFCTNLTWRDFSANRTVRVESPPTVNLESPKTANRSNTAAFFVGFNVSSNFIGSGLNNNLFDCRIWDNSTGNWTRGSLGITAGNNTSITYPHIFNQTNNASWNVECAERNEPSVKAFATSNSTILIDLTSPTITVNGPADQSYDTDRIIVFNFTGTDSNLDSCSLYHNASGTWILNTTNKTSVVSGSPVVVAQRMSGDGNVIWASACNDTVGRNTFMPANYSLTVDTSVTTTLNVTNVTIPNTCTNVGISWNTSEARNGSIKYGTTVNLGENATANTNMATVHTANLTFGNRINTLFNYNTTSCDTAGNCNTTAYSVTTPLGLCNDGGNNAGWNAYAVLDNIATLGTLANQSGASLVYWWNATSQSWLGHQKGTSTNSDYAISYGHAALFYSATNTTWFRNSTRTGGYFLNLTVGDNFFGTTTPYNFSNLTYTFLNSSRQDYVAVHGNFNLSNNSIYFANWNNTAHSYLSHIRNTSFEEATVLPRGEVAWTWVDRYNLTWNTTAIQLNLSLLT